MAGGEEEVTCGVSWVHEAHSPRYRAWLVRRDAWCVLRQWTAFEVLITICNVSGSVTWAPLSFGDLDTDNPSDSNHEP